MDTYCSPRLLAEDVAADLAAAAVKRYETRRTPAGLLHSAWNHAEYAMNQQCPEESVPYYFETASTLAGDILSRGELVGNQKVGQNTQLDALVLSTYLPLFAKRTKQEVVEREDCAMIYKSLGCAVRYLRPLEITEPPQWKMVETATMALSARIGKPELLLYPASPREESSVEDDLNHDSYFYVDRKKLPIQQKLLPTQHVYDDCITILTLEPILAKALQAERQSVAIDTLAEKINYLLSLIVAETTEANLSRQETRFLNFLTQAVAAHHAELTTEKFGKKTAA